MVQTAVTQIVKTLNDVHQRFGLQRSPNDQFFTEWYVHVLSLDGLEQETLEWIRQRFCPIRMRDRLWFCRVRRSLLIQNEVMF